MFPCPRRGVFSFASWSPPRFSYIVRPLRKPLWEMASSLAVGGGFKRPPPDDQEKWIWRAQEFMTFTYAATGIGLMVLGLLPWKVLVLWYLTAVFILFTNGLRTLAAHCYCNPPDHEMSFFGAIP